MHPPLSFFSLLICPQFRSDLFSSNTHFVKMQCNKPQPLLLQSTQRRREYQRLDLINAWVATSSNRSTVEIQSPKRRSPSSMSMAAQSPSTSDSTTTVSFSFLFFLLQQWRVSVAVPLSSIFFQIEQIYL